MYHRPFGWMLLYWSFTVLAGVIVFPKASTALPPKASSRPVSKQKLSKQTTRPTSSSSSRKSLKQLLPLQGLYILDKPMMVKRMRMQIIRLSKRRQRFALLAMEMLNRSALQIRLGKSGHASIQAKVFFIGKSRQRRWEGTWKKQGCFVFLHTFPAKARSPKSAYRLRCKVDLHRLSCQGLDTRRRVHFVVRKKLL